MDGILLSPAPYANLAQVSIQHINADFPDILAEDEVIPYRATDHDLPVVVINLDQLIPTPAPTRNNGIPISPQPTVHEGGSSGDSWGWLGGLGLLVAAGGTAVWVRRRRQ